MKNLLKEIFGSGEHTVAYEWRTDDSIFKFLLRNIDTNGSLNDAAQNLPDEKRDDDSKLRFAPGLMDALFGSNTSDDSAKRIGELTKLLVKVARYGDKKAGGDFYNSIVSNEGVIGIIDGFSKSVASQALPVQPYLFSFSKDLALKTSHRNSVKFGIALIGLCQNKSVINELKVLGLHDEFTVFVTVALSYLSDNLAQDLWQLAQKVDGWGKIQIVDRLAKMELSDAQRDWLIRRGYQNSIMNEYLAFTCALNGNLHDKLQSESIDMELFKSSEEIVEALISGGPAEDISAYIYASDLVENFIRHAKTWAADLADFLALHQIEDFLIDLQKDIGEHKKNGWTDDNISNCIIDINAILNSRDWKEQTYQALNSLDRLTYWNAKSAASKLGIDVWEIVWKKLLEQPMDGDAWYDVTHYAKQDKAEQVIDFALKTLPLGELATGPKDSMGLGPDFVKYQTLDWIITFLEDYPQKGEQIILTGLNSPITRNRNMAIKVLAKWKMENWSAAIRQELKKLSTIEPNNDTKINIVKLLNNGG
jgi:hypothetical protein